MRTMILILLLASHGLIGAEQEFILLQNIKVANLKHEPVTLDVGKAKLNILILLHQATCGGFMVEKEYWDKLRIEFQSEEVSIAGIYVQYDENIQRTVERNKFKFGVYLDEFQEAQKMFKPAIFPMKYIFQEGGRLIFIGWPSRFRERDDDFYKNVKYLHYLLVQ